MVMMELMKAAADPMAVEDGPVHPIFQQRPGRGAQKDQMEPVKTGQFQENRGGQRDGDEVAEMSNTPHHRGGQCRSHRYATYSTQFDHIAAAGRGFSATPWTAAREWNRFL
jgi:hypothetical protein